MNLKRLISVVMCFALGGSVQALAAEADAGGDDVTVEALHGWKAAEGDNICGISDLKKVTRPALVDYDELMKATPQMKQIDKKGIDPESAEGKALRDAACKLITKSCETVRKANGFCSVWKEISHQDEREIPDLTDDVVERF